MNASTFGFLCVIDGVRVLDDGGVSSLELLLIGDGHRTLLNGEDSEMLHDLYQGMVHEDVYGAAV